MRLELQTTNQSTQPEPGGRTGQRQRRVRRALALAALLVVAGAGAGQTPPPTDRIEAAFDRLYDYDFAGAHAILDAEQRARPGDPLIPAVRGAAYLFSEFERQRILELEFFANDRELTDRKRMKPDPAVRERLLRTTAEARRLAEARLAADPADRDALFALSTAVGTETDYMALVEKRYLKAYLLSKESQRHARQMLALDPPDYDAYLTIGAVEYVVSKLNPFFRLFVRFEGIEGSQERAVARLETAAAHGRYFGPFARILLAALHAREKRPEQALALLRELHRDYPGNSLVGQEIARIEGSTGDQPRAEASPTTSGEHVPVEGLSRSATRAPAGRAPASDPTTRR